MGSEATIPAIGDGKSRTDASGGTVRDGSMRDGLHAGSTSAGSMPGRAGFDDPTFDALRRRGYRGTPIPVHRALAWERVRGSTIVGAILAALCFDALLLWQAPALTRFWRDTLAFWLAPLLDPGRIAMVPHELLPGWSIGMADVGLGAGAPTGVEWLNALLFAVALLLLSVILPHRARPVAYLLRLVAAVQLSANLYFYLTPGQFPYSLRSHVTTLASGQFVLMLLVPWIHALAWYPFDHRWSRKLLLTVLTLLFFAVFTPVSLALHAWLIHAGSLVLLPVLYLVFGYPVGIFLLVSLYGWGMSWKR